MDRKGAAETNRAIIKRLQKLPVKARRSLTLDNGTENAKHEKLTVRLGIKCYFAHPYAAWQRGTNEHINGLIRWYLPKGTDFSKIDKEQIARIESLINNAPENVWALKHPLKLLPHSLHFEVELVHKKMEAVDKQIAALKAEQKAAASPAPAPQAEMKSPAPAPHAETKSPAPAPASNAKPHGE